MQQRRSHEQLGNSRLENHTVASLARRRPTLKLTLWSQMESVGVAVTFTASCVSRKLALSRIHTENTAVLAVAFPHVQADWTDSPFHRHQSASHSELQLSLHIHHTERAVSLPASLPSDVWDTNLWSQQCFYQLIWWGKHIKLFHSQFISYSQWNSYTEYNHM